MTGVAQEPLLAVADLWIEAEIEGERRNLVAGTDLALGRGEVLGIVGESGSGKSLSARALVGLLPRGLEARGSVRFEGRELIGAPERELRSTRGQGIALVLQDPFTTLNPLIKCEAQIGPTHGPRRSRQERREDAVRRLAEVGIRDPGVAERYPWQLSGGMRQRVALAAALANDPKLLVADEFTTALDVTTQKEIWLLLRRIQKARGMGLLIITHDLRMAFSVCDRVHVMYAGRCLEAGGAGPVSERPEHPYTLGLLLSEPDVEEASDPELLMRGHVPRADEVAEVCAFAARCSWANEQCCAARPPLAKTEPGRESACIRIGEIGTELFALRARQLAHRGEQAAPPAPADSEPIVTVTELVKRFAAQGGEQGTVTALGGVSLEIRTGECVGLVGESGSGKTTLARCLVGLATPSSGRIEIAGIDATRPSQLEREQRRALRNSIQYVFQDPYSSLNPTKTVGATLTEAISLRVGREKAVIAARLNELLELVGLPSRYAERKPVALSGGERQRVAIARALALQPRIVVCDEPVSSLDVSVQAQVLELLNEIRAETGVSYLFITHDLAVVRQVADRIYVLYHGEVVEHGAARELLGNPTDEYTRALLAAAPGQWDRDSGLGVVSASG